MRRPERVEGYTGNRIGLIMANEDEDHRALPPGIVRAREPEAPASLAPRPPFPTLAGGHPGEGVTRSAGGEGGSEGRITAIEPQERRAGRVSVFVDGRFAIGLFEEVSAALGLRVGQAITPERLQEIARAETLRRAREDAYRLLGFRARSENEIRDRLARKGFEDEVIAQVLDGLRTDGYVDDRAFTEGWVEARGGTRGRRALAHELRQKGVAADVVGETLQGARTEADELAAARAAALKKLGGTRPADRSREAQARLAAFLQRRGFGWDVVRPVLAELYGAAAGEEEAAQENLP